MHQNRFSRTMALLLAGLMAASSFAACASTDTGDQTDPAVTTAAPAVVETTAAPETEPAYVYPEVSYNGADFTILNAKDRYEMLYQLMPTELTGEALNDVRHRLNHETAERYGINLKETQVGYGDLQNYAMQEILSNSPVHDIFYLSPKQIAALMNAGYLHNLLDVDKLNLEGDWWDQTLIEDGTLKDKYLYYLGGNYHIQGFEGTTCIFFNKNMMNNLGLEAPYQLVRDGKWTLDKLYEYAAKGANLNGDASFSSDGSGSAVYGIVTIKNMMAGFLMGAEGYYVEKNEDGMPVIAFTSEHFQNVCSKIANLTSAEGLYLYKGTSAPMLIDNRALMIGAEIKSAANELRDMKDEFGMLPMPKYDEAQEDYVNNMFWATHTVCIPVTCKDVDRAAIVIDTLNYEAAERLLPIYYERVCYKGLRDEDSIDMLEIIRRTRYYNWGLAYEWLETIEPTIHNDFLLVGNGDVASRIKATSGIVQKLIDKTMSGLQ